MHETREEDMVRMSRMRDYKIVAEVLVFSPTVGECDCRGAAGHVPVLRDGAGAGGTVAAGGVGPVNGDIGA
jgi:hypothetical protein